MTSADFCKTCGSFIESRQNRNRARRRGYGYCSHSCAAPKMAPQIERFMRHASPEPNTGCWLWTGSVDKQGYGQLARGPTKKAHRLSYELFNGLIPVGQFVCHSCDQPGCVNPDHLFIGTALDNNQDAMRKGRTACGQGKSASKLTDDAVRYIRSSRLNSTALANMFDVSVATVSRARHGNTWRHVE